MKITKEQLTKKEALLKLFIGILFIVTGIAFFFWYQFSEAYFSKQINEWKAAISTMLLIYGLKNVISFAFKHNYKMKLK